jgi:hypothetical protein
MHKNLHCVFVYLGWNKSVGGWPGEGSAAIVAWRSALHYTALHCTALAVWRPGHSKARVSAELELTAALWPKAGRQEEWLHAA